MPDTAQNPTFEHECERAVAGLKSALIALFDAGAADPTRPQDVARKLGINKTLTWNISRFLEAADPIDAISFIPAAGSIARVADAFPQTPRLIEAKLRVNDAASGLDAMIARHADDRGTLELILDNAAGSEEDRLAISRRLTFRGNSGICGVQSKTRLSTWFMAPSANDPTKLDLATVRGYVRVRRLRPHVEWAIFKTRNWGEDGPGVEDNREAIDPAAPPGVPLLMDFCRGDVPRVDPEWTPEGKDFVLRSGPVGNAGAFDCFAGELMRNEVGRYAEANDDIGEVGTAIAMPSESVIVDLIYHKSLDMSGARALIFGEIFSHGKKTPTDMDGRVLPMRPRLTPIAGNPPAVATPLVPQYGEMLQTVFDRAGWKGEDFAGLRLEIQYPPMQSQIVIRFPLPKGP